jgi:bis(5'-nucleosidyl)-tetraphosphatase
MNFEKSCGAVVYYKTDEVILYLIVKHKIESGGHWGFAKGKVEKNELENETAKREILEETNVEVEFVDGFKEQVQYECRGNVCKTVIYFLAKSNTTETKTQTSELDDSKFATFNDALNLLTYEDSKKILKSANKFLLKFFNTRLK